MPARKITTKEMILKASYNIVRECGMEELNIRNIAKSCNCSTQPIYLSYKGIDEIKAELSEIILNRYNEYLQAEIDGGKYPVYKAMGMGYIRFAKEEKELFKYLFMQNNGVTENNCGNGFNRAVQTVMRDYGLNEERAQKLHTEMWVFVHGIATMYATDYLDWDWETVSGMLTDIYRGLNCVINGEKP